MHGYRLPAAERTPILENRVSDYEYAMDIKLKLTPDQEALVHQGIEAGRYRSREDAVRDALVRWEDDERTRAELLEALEESERDFEAGRYVEYTAATLPQLVGELKQEARQRRAR